MCVRVEKETGKLSRQDLNSEIQGRKLPDNNDITSAQRYNHCLSLSLSYYYDKGQKQFWDEAMAIGLLLMKTKTYQNTYDG